MKLKTENGEYLKDNMETSKKQPLVSVVLPTYNRAHLIVKSIETVLEQSYKNLELIVVDDCSTDNTRQRVKDIKDSRLKYIKIERNAGPAYARNKGIKLSGGEYIAFQDDDDRWMRDKLQKQVDVLMSSPESVGIVYTGIYKLIKGKNEYIPSKKNINREGCIFEELLRGNFVPIHALVRRSCFEKVGFFDESMPALEDWDMWLRMAEKYEFFYIREALSVCYSTIDGVSSDWRKIIIARSIVLKKYFRNLAGNKPLLSHHYFRIGKIWSTNGEFYKGCGYLMKAIGIYPCVLYYWKMLIKSFFGIGIKFLTSGKYQP